jgi:hypothetical protein
MIPRFRRLSVAAALGLAGCSDSSGPAAATRTFVIQVSTESFKIRVDTDAQAIALRSRMASGSVGVISGELVAGDGGFNAPWSWHLRPSTITVPDVAIELCDGRPSFVENDLSYWISTVRQFCPWGAKVMSEQ